MRFGSNELMMAHSKQSARQRIRSTQPGSCTAADSQSTATHEELATCADCERKAGACIRPNTRSASSQSRRGTQWKHPLQLMPELEQFATAYPHIRNACQRYQLALENGCFQGRDGLHVLVPDNVAGQLPSNLFFNDREKAARYRPMVEGGAQLFQVGWEKTAVGLGL